MYFPTSRGGNYSVNRMPSVKITCHEAGMSILEFLADRFTYHSRLQWRDLICAHRLLLNQHPASPSAILWEGDTLTYFLPDLPEPAVDKDFSIVFEDDILLVVDKPANLPCHPSGRYFEHTLTAVLKEQFGLHQAVLVNRIDRETSGLVLLAKTTEAARECRRQFETRAVYKRYVALVEGEFPLGKIAAVGYLARDSASPVRKKQRLYFPRLPTEIPSGAKACVTHLHRIRSHQRISEVAAVPVTGRCHQIRATLWSLGYPVVGDKIYGIDDGMFLRFISGELDCLDRQRLRLSRQALHSAELHLIHPQSGKFLKFNSPVPEEMRNLMWDGRPLNNIEIGLEGWFCNL